MAFTNKLKSKVRYDPCITPLGSLFYRKDLSPKNSMGELFLQMLLWHFMDTD